MHAIQKTEYFENWFRRLQDFKAKAKILARLKRIELGNFGDCEPVGNGIFELKIHTLWSWLQSVFYKIERNSNPFAKRGK